MKITPWFFCLLWGLAAKAQLSEVHGVVSIQNSQTETGRRQYVAGAVVSDDLDSAQSVITDDAGRFRLIYVGKPAGVGVHFHVVKPSADLEVVNISALYAVTGQNDVVRISMAPKGKIAGLRQKIYEVGKTAAEKRLDELLRKDEASVNVLKKDSARNAGKITELTREIAGLEEGRKKIEAYAQDLAQRYAAVNLDDASPLFKKAFLLFQDGDLDGAMATIEQADLGDMVKSILQEREKIAEVDKDLKVRDSIQSQRSKDAEKALQLKADIHKALYQFDSVAECYESLIELQPANLEYLFDYAHFLQWLNKFDQAFYLYSKLQTIAKTHSGAGLFNRDIVVASTDVNMGDLYFDKNDIRHAEAAYLEAQEIYERLAVDAPEIYQNYIALTQDNLGNVYKREGQYQRAEASYLESLSTRRKLAAKDEAKYTPLIAQTQINLGNLYEKEHEAVKAETAFMEALGIYRRLARSSPKEYEPGLATALNNLGILYFDEDKYAAAETAYQEAMAIYSRLMKTNPAGYEPMVVAAKFNLAALFKYQKDYARALPFFQDVAEICGRLAITNPGTYKPKLGQTLLDLAEIYGDLIDTMQTAEEKIAGQQRVIGALEKACALYKNNMEIVRQLSDAYGNLAWFQLLARQYNEAEQSARKGLSTDDTRIWIKTNLAHALLLQGRFDAAMAIYTVIKPLKNDKNESFARICLEDLEEFDKAGIKSPGIDKVKKFLKE